MLSTEAVFLIALSNLVDGRLPGLTVEGHDCEFLLLGHRDAAPINAEPLRVRPRSVKGFHTAVRAEGVLCDLGVEAIA